MNIINIEGKFSYNGTIYTRLENPCEHHEIAFPSNDVDKYPEIKNMNYFLCPVCGWFIYNKKQVNFERSKLNESL